MPKPKLHSQRFPCKACKGPKSGPPQCELCSEKHERHFCNKCEISRLLKCSRCNFLACVLCRVNELSPNRNKLVEEELWETPCADDNHQGPNERFCRGCTRKCAACTEQICNGCFLSNFGVCRSCIIDGKGELEAFDKSK